MRQHMDITRTRVLFVFLLTDVTRFQEVMQCSVEEERNYTKTH